MHDLAKNIKEKDKRVQNFIREDQAAKEKHRKECEAKALEASKAHEKKTK